MKVLVTGGAGFIGSHIVDTLVQANLQVYILDNLTTGSFGNISPEAVFLKKDIRDADLKEVLVKERFDYVIHQAAQTMVGKSLEEPYYDCDVNIRGLVNLLEACRLSEVKRFVFASSAAIYGDTAALPIDEEGEKQPVSFYGQSKLTGEHYLNLYYKNFGLEYVVLRYANVFGERQGANGEGGVISIFLNKLLAGQELTVYGDGNQTRDYVYVKDVAQANYQALFADTANRSYNVSTARETSINELLALLSSLRKEPVTVRNEGMRCNDIRRSVLANQAAQDGLKWMPTYTLSEGLELMLHALQQKHFK